MLIEPSKRSFLSMISTNESVLEIGPFTHPVCGGKNVKYFDVLNKAGLIKRAEALGRSTDGAVDIHYVSPLGDLSIVQEKFDICISSHAIEHQPDLIRHLNDVEKILNDGGRYFLVIPDKRYCFDHYIPESSIADILTARGRKIHTLKSVIEHRALTTHNDVQKHWAGDHGVPKYITDPKLLSSAAAEYERANGGYIDVHAWQFNPNSFRRNISLLNSLGLIRLKVDQVFQTAYGSIEFYAILRRAD